MWYDRIVCWYGIILFDCCNCLIVVSMSALTFDNSRTRFFSVCNSIARIFAWLRYVSSSIRSIVFSFVFDDKCCRSCLFNKYVVVILFKINSSWSDENEVVSNIETNSSKKVFDDENWDSVDKGAAVDEDSMKNRKNFMINFCFRKKIFAC